MHSDPEPHPVQPYVVSSSEEDMGPMIMERKNTSQYVSTILNQVNQELIDVPSLTYTLYGSNSPYRYCDEYRTIISTVRIMGELLNISMEPEVDLTPSLEEVLTKPSNVDYGLLNRCGQELEDIVESLKIHSESIVVEF